MMWQCHVSSSECRCYRLNGFSLLKRFPLSADGACGKALDQPVGEWLEHVGLPQYESKFLLNGFDDLRFMVSHLQHVISRVCSTLLHSASPYVNSSSICLFMSLLCTLTLCLSLSSFAPPSDLLSFPLTLAHFLFLPPFPSPFHNSSPLCVHDPAKIYGPSLILFKEYGLSPKPRRIITKAH